MAIVLKSTQEFVCFGGEVSSFYLYYRLAFNCWVSCGLAGAELRKPKSSIISIATPFHYTNRLMNATLPANETAWMCAPQSVFRRVLNSHITPD